MRRSDRKADNRKSEHGDDFTGGRNRDCGDCGKRRCRYCGSGKYRGKCTGRCRGEQGRTGAYNRAGKPQQEAEQSKPEETTPSQEEKPEPEPPISTEAPTPAPTEPEQPKEQPTEAPAEVETVAYDPYEVVSLATAKTKAYGKISIPEDLDNMLANGEITKEEYDEYYPYDGAGYYSVFVETDLNQAATTSGRKLGSVDGIASYIAEMLSLETGPYFYIEYAGVHSINGTDFYEFRCYRA